METFQLILYIFALPIPALAFLILDLKKRPWASALVTGTIFLSLGGLLGPTGLWGRHWLLDTGGVYLVILGIFQYGRRVVSVQSEASFQSIRYYIYALGLLAAPYLVLIPPPIPTDLLAKALGITAALLLGVSWILARIRGKNPDWALAAAAPVMATVLAGFPEVSLGLGILITNVGILHRKILDSYKDHAAQLYSAHQAKTLKKTLELLSKLSCRSQEQLNEVQHLIGTDPGNSGRQVMTARFIDLAKIQKTTHRLLGAADNAGPIPPQELKMLLHNLVPGWEVSVPTTPVKVDLLSYLLVVTGFMDLYQEKPQAKISVDNLWTRGQMMVQTTLEYPRPLQGEPRDPWLQEYLAENRNFLCNWSIDSEGHSCTLQILTSNTAQ